MRLVLFGCEKTKQKEWGNGFAAFVFSSFGGGKVSNCHIFVCFLICHVLLSLKIILMWKFNPFVIRGQAEREFKVEVEAIGRVRHKNLVRLLGYCVEGAYRYWRFYSNLREFSV